MENLFEPHRNCYRRVKAHRAAFVVDGEAYFQALRDAFRKARHTIFIIGWDLHSDMRLVRKKGAHDEPIRLGAFLDRLASTNTGLHIYLLSWDFSMIYAMEREFFPRYKLEWRTHKRIHFCLDGHHPIGASQHQKIVVIDDAVAFVGGFDVSKWRGAGAGARCSAAICRQPAQPAQPEAFGFRPDGRHYLSRGACGPFFRDQSDRRGL